MCKSDYDPTEPEELSPELSFPEYSVWGGHDLVIAKVANTGFEAGLEFVLYLERGKEKPWAFSRGSVGEKAQL